MEDDGPLLSIVATLRELGLGLADVRRVLAGQASIAEVAAVHRDALDARIRVLQLHRAAMAVVVKHAASDEERTWSPVRHALSAGPRRGTCPTTPRPNRSTPGWNWPGWSVTGTSGGGPGS
jgi:hypothetical protein